MHEVVIDRSADGLAAYLSEYVGGVGPARARKIVEHFGDDTLAILETTPGRAAEVPGIPADVAEKIAGHFRDKTKVDPAAFASLNALFAGHRVPKRVLIDLIENWGSAAVDTIKAAPYSILLPYPRMGWKSVDPIATGPTRSIPLVDCSGDQSFVTRRDQDFRLVPAYRRRWSRWPKSSTPPSQAPSKPIVVKAKKRNRAAAGKQICGTFPMCYFVPFLLSSVLACSRSVPRTLNSRSTLQT